MGGQYVWRPGIDCEFNISLDHNRLAHIEGHVCAVKRMVEEDIPRPPVLEQIAAIRSALKGVGRMILEDNVQCCTVKTTQDTFLDLKKSLDQFIG